MSPMKGQHLEDGEFSSTYSEAWVVRVCLKGDRQLKLIFNTDGGRVRGQVLPHQPLRIHHPLRSRKASDWLCYHQATSNRCGRSMNGLPSMTGPALMGPQVAPMVTVKV